MRSVKNFIIDFAGYFILHVGSVLIAIVEVITQIVFTLQKFWDGVVKPSVVDMLADAHLLMLILLQSWYDVSAKFSLCVCKYLNNYTKFALQKSEHLIHKTWIHS